MTTPPRNSRRAGIWTWAAFLFFALGTVASLYYAYDLRYPNRFVGDMYGMEVMFRLLVLSLIAGPMLVGGLVLCVGSWKRKRRLRVVGTAIMIVSSAVMISMAVDIGQSRYLNEVRRHYPEKSVEQLLAIAREQKDQQAIDALTIKADPAAVPGLALILLDEHEPGNLRYASAQALATLGGDDALKALEKARGSSRDEHFKEFVAHMIDHIRSGQ